MSDPIYEFILSLAKDAEPGYENTLASIGGFYLEDNYLSKGQRQVVRRTAGYQKKAIPEAFEILAAHSRIIEADQTQYGDRSRTPAATEFFDDKQLDVFDEAIARDLARSQIDTNQILSELLSAVAIACANASEKLGGVTE